MGRLAQQPAADIDPGIIDEAADWLVRLQSGEPADLDELARWRKRSPVHEAAWERAESMLADFDRVPPGIGRSTLNRLGRKDRRRFLGLAVLALAGPVGLMSWRSSPWQTWSADLRTAAGERRSLDLSDGTRLVLDTATAVNVEFTATERRLTLIAGEVLVTTARDPSPRQRPLVVHTGEGVLRPLGTRFSVRQFDGSARVAVFEGAVQLRTARSQHATVVRAGEQVAFEADRVGATGSAVADAVLWDRGMLLVRERPLGELLDELARYQSGLLRYEEAVAGLIVSGAFPVTDVQASLALLEKTLPIRVSRPLPFWVMVQAH